MAILLEFSHVDQTQGYRTWDHEETFENMKAVREYLKENYPHKRTAMYVDMKDGSTKKCGYVYHRRDKYPDTGKTFLEEIWVRFYEIKPIYFS